MLLQDNNSNLLQYLVKVYTRDYENDAGRNEAHFRFPDPTLMFQAAQTSFVDLDHELTQLQHQLNTHGKKVRGRMFNRLFTEFVDGQTTHLDDSTSRLPLLVCG